MIWQNVLSALKVFDENTIVLMVPPEPGERHRRTKLTNASRRIRNAWHLCFAVNLVDLGGMWKHRYYVAHHLSGRYIFLGKVMKNMGLLEMV